MGYVDGDAGRILGAWIGAKLNFQMKSIRINFDSTHIPDMQRPEETTSTLPAKFKAMTWPSCGSLVLWFCGLARLTRSSARLKLAGGLMDRFWKHPDTPCMFLWFLDVPPFSSQCLGKSLHLSISHLCTSYLADVDQTKNHMLRCAAPGVSAR